MVWKQPRSKEKHKFKQKHFAQLSLALSLSLSLCARVLVPIFGAVTSFQRLLALFFGVVAPTRATWTSLLSSSARRTFSAFLRLLQSLRLASSAAFSSAVVPSWNFRVNNQTIAWSAAFRTRPCSLLQRQGNETSRAVPQSRFGMCSHNCSSGDANICCVQSWLKLNPRRDLPGTGKRERDSSLQWSGVFGYTWCGVAAADASSLLQTCLLPSSRSLVDPPKLA